MAAPRSKLISTLVSKKLYGEVDQILSISRQGFDVHVKTEFPEVEKVLIEFLEQELKINSREFRLTQDPEEIYSEYEMNENDDLSFIPILLVSNESLKSGYGFVKIEIPSPDFLLSSVPSAIESILTHFGLEFYIDIFDAQKSSSLKQITRVHGLSILIDSVIQTAYLGGFKGEVDKAQKYLERIQMESDGFLSEKEVPLEKCAEKFFSYVILRGEDAYCFLKSCLSHYSINIQGLSMTRASQVLSVSRTTLQEHLKIADQLGVSNFFEGYIQKSI